MTKNTRSLRLVLNYTKSAALLLVSLNPAHAVISIQVAYDADTEFTTIYTSGSWDRFPSNPAVEFRAGPNITSNSFSTLSGQASVSGKFLVGGGLTLSSGDGLTDVRLPSGASRLTVTGDILGFSAFRFHAPVGYTAGDELEATLIIYRDIFDTINKPNQSGEYTGNGNTVTWKTVEAIVREGATPTQITFVDFNKDTRNVTLRWLDTGGSYSIQASNDLAWSSPTRIELNGSETKMGDDLQLIFTDPGITDSTQTRFWRVVSE